MNEIELIQNKIYEIRGQRVMLDRDLAELYGVETKRLNEAVKRNIRRFEGDDFMFQLTKDEASMTSSRSQFATLNKGRGNNVKYLPFAFTELGVAMLSSVLRSEIAINVNREIMRAFVTLRHIITLPDDSNRILVIEQELKKLKDEMNDILRDQNDINEETPMQLDAILIALAELQAKPKEEKPHHRIGFIQDDK